MYVSTVDSGNLAGHLLAVGAACRELAGATLQEPGTSERLAAIAAMCERLAWEADFGFLYHRRRHLFHIGFRVAEQELDAGFYDLLASESRLTSLLAIAKGDVPVGPPQGDPSNATYPSSPASLLSGACTPAPHGAI